MNMAPKLHDLQAYSPPSNPNPNPSPNPSPHPSPNLDDLQALLAAFFAAEPNSRAIVFVSRHATLPCLLPPYYAYLPPYHAYLPLTMAT